MTRTLLGLRVSPKRLMPLVLAAMPLLGTRAQENCCVQPYSYFDCTGSGHIASPGKLYTCVETSTLAGCMSCLVEDNESVGTCSTCCTIQEDIECQKLESEWEFYASTLFFICLCCCFTALCGFTEVRRKKKGISFAQAWSVPQAMPILRTWPRRPLSASDITEAADGGVSEAGQQWAPLSDDEEDLKRYPVAGLVDDSGMAFGFVTSMPQSLLSSVATSLRRSGTPNPPSPQEPELTVWISRDSGGTSALTASAYHGGPVSAVEATRPGSSSDRSNGSGDVRPGPGQQRAVVVGNDLEEPFILDEAGAGAGAGARAEAGVGPARRERVQTGLPGDPNAAAEPRGVAATT